MKLIPNCSACWGTIQPDEERTPTPSTGIPSYRHTDPDICALLSSEDASTPDWGPRVPEPADHYAA